MFQAPEAAYAAIRKPEHQPPRDLISRNNRTTAPDGHFSRSHAPRFLLELDGIFCATLAFFLADSLAQNPNARFKSRALTSTKMQRGGLSNDKERKTGLGRPCARNRRDVCVDRFHGVRAVASNKLALVRLGSAPPPIKKPSRRGSADRAKLADRCPPIQAGAKPRSIAWPEKSR